jgi:hypothetical protein
MESMNRMRMQSSPRPASGRRVVAGKRTRPDETKNCVRKLLKREISRAGNLAFNRTNSQEKFRNFHLQVCVCVRVLHRSVSLKSLANGDKSLYSLRRLGFLACFPTAAKFLRLEPGSRVAPECFDWRVSETVRIRVLFPPFLDSSPRCFWVDFKSFFRVYRRFVSPFGDQDPEYDLSNASA